MTIAVTGATGQLGRLAIAALKARGAQNVVALVRDPAKGADLGVSLSAFDYHKPETFGALKGIDTLVLISSSDFNDRAGQHRAVIEAAKAAGVGRIVYTSLLKGDTSPMLMLRADHVATEAVLKASGVPHVVLRNGWYTENYTGSLGLAVEHGAIIGAAGEGRLTTASRADYAEAIAVVAMDASHNGKVYELAGDVAYTMADMAAEASRVTGKPVAYVAMTEAEYAKALEGFGLPAPVAAVFAQCDAVAAEGALYDDSHTLSKLIGRPTTPMAETVRAALA